MQNPFDFKRILMPVMAFITFLHLSFGTISFLAHGVNTSSSALFDLPLKDIKFMWVPISYAVTLLLGTP